MTRPVGYAARSAEPVVLVASRIRVEERALFEALRRRAVPGEHVDDRSIVYRVGADGPRWRAVLNRAISATRRLEVSRWCTAVGTPVLNTPETLARCDNKIATSLALESAGVPIPRTVIALDASAGPRAVEEAGFPAVVKPVNGSWGRGVSRVCDQDSSEAVFDLRAQLASPAQKLAYTQEFVQGRDLRVLVVGGRAVAAIARESDGWVRNMARDARATAYELDPELAGIAERAAEAVGDGVLGVDLLETPEGERLVLEVNSSVEFRGLAEAHPKLRVADVIVDHLLDRIPG